MTSIRVFDVDADEIEMIAYDNHIIVAEIVEMLMNYVEIMKEDNGLV